jgi:hypothetical protein
MASTRFLRSVTLDMGEYLETAEVTDDHMGNMTIRAAGGCIPRIIPKPTNARSV